MRFKDLVDLQSERIQPKDITERMIYLGYENFKPGGLRYDLPKNPQIPDSSKFAFHNEDIIYGRLRPYFRKVAWCKHQGVCSSDFWVFRAKSGVDSRFAFYTAALPAFSDHATLSATGTRMPRASWEAVKEFKVQDFSYEEQVAIGTLLGALDDKIESMQLAVSHIERFIFTLFEKYFLEVSDLKESIPLSSLIGVNPKYPLKKGDRRTKVSMAHIDAGTAVVSRWSKSDVAGGARFMNGDVVFARITPCLENGKVAIIDMLEADEVGFGSTEFIVLSPRGDISTAWIYSFVRQPSFKAKCVQNMTGTSGRQRLQASFFDNYHVPVPNSTTLDLFNMQTKSMLVLLTNYRNQSRLLADLRDTLLPELMSGRMQVDEAQGLVINALETEDTYV